MRGLALWLLWMFLVALTLPEEAPEWFIGMISGGVIAGGVVGWFLIQETRKVKELRERLGESEPSAIYRNLTKKQLKNKTLTHVKNIRSFIDGKAWDRTKLTIMTIAKENDEKGKLMAEDEKEYKKDGLYTKSLQLRNELWVRLPRDCRAGEICKNENLCEMLYTKTLTLNCMNTIANDLERLANSLKT